MRRRAPLATRSEPTALFTYPLRLKNNNKGEKLSKHKEPPTMTEPQNTEQGLSPEVDQVTLRIEEIGASLSAQAYVYREPDADNRPRLAKDLLCLIDDAQAAGKVLCSVAEIAE